jgi:hypothetical protein
MDTLITPLKAAAKEDWPISRAAFLISGLFKAIPFHAQATLLIDVGNVIQAMKACHEMMVQHQDPGSSQTRRR